MRKALLGVMAASALLAMQTSAAALTIDFRTSAWSDGHGVNSTTEGGVTVTATPGNAKLAWDATDGFGINGPVSIPTPWGTINLPDLQPDEIDSFEMLTVSFSGATLLNGFQVADLYREGIGRFTYDERGYYSVDGGVTFTPFSANPGASNGELYVSLFPTLITSIQFVSVNIPIVGQLHDFTVQGLDVSAPPPAVPEPTSMVLLGTGLVGLAHRIRRRKRA